MSSFYEAAEVIAISGTNPKKCMACGKCTATCPADMPIPPHKVVRYVMQGKLDVFEEGHDYKDKDFDGIDTLLNCLSCFACVQRCPRGVEPAALVEALRVQMLRPQGEGHLDPDDLEDLIGDGQGIPQQLLVSAFRKYSK
ncbi:MAG: 4Fe-4S dicluster domain-containing protein [Defluviitaleaceae bacterium]|nr:4Fe-4S dicluster domain-containing protein [Defluviitaleaceae bacterium]